MESLLSAGIFAMRTVGQPGTHGAGMAGIQGMGVNTPIAAEVAEATVGFASELHIPKGKIFNIGTLSIMLAAGMEAFTRFVGNTVKVEGATPKLHDNKALLQTRNPIF